MYTYTYFHPYFHTCIFTLYLYLPCIFIVLDHEYTRRIRSNFRLFCQLQHLFASLEAIQILARNSFKWRHIWPSSENSGKLMNHHRSRSEMGLPHLVHRHCMILAIVILTLSSHKDKEVGYTSYFQAIPSVTAALHPHSVRWKKF